MIPIANNCSRKNGDNDARNGNPGTDAQYKTHKNITSTPNQGE